MRLSKMKPIKEEELERVIAAISSAKYSLACVLFLQFTGYDPRLFIPYRTLNRIKKENRDAFRL